MSNAQIIQPLAQPISGSIRPPGSKSITNRALIIAALAEGESRLTGVLDSRDTEVMFNGLRSLGVEWERDLDTASARVVGCGGNIPAQQADLYLENSGTSIRFLTAMTSTGSGEFNLTGNSRMTERPIRDLVNALNQLGAGAKCSQTGCPPVTVRADHLSGGIASVRGDMSSQFLSALLMASPAAASEVELEIEGTLVSRPYVDMTLAVMQSFGVAISETSTGSFTIAPQAYRACDYSIEPDASAASYFFAAAAITGGKVTVEGLSRDALQGDVGFVNCLAQMGCEVEYGESDITVTGGELSGIDVDMNAISDTAQTLAVVAAFASGPTRIRNIEHNRHKETDRITAVATELRRMGVDVDEFDDGMTIHPAPPQPAEIQTYDDHRMAMSFALAGLRADGIRIADPECTSKTYPEFFRDLDRLCGRQ